MEWLKKPGVGVPETYPQMLEMPESVGDFYLVPLRCWLWDGYRARPHAPPRSWPCSFFQTVTRTPVSLSPPPRPIRRLPATCCQLFACFRPPLPVPSDHPTATALPPADNPPRSHPLPPPTVSRPFIGAVASAPPPPLPGHV